MLTSLVMVVAAANPGAHVEARVGETYVAQVANLPESYWLGGGCLPSLEFKSATTAIETDCEQGSSRRLQYRFIDTEGALKLHLRDAAGAERSFNWERDAEGRVQMPSSSGRWHFYVRAPVGRRTSRQRNGPSPAELSGQRFYEQGLVVRDYWRFLNLADWRTLEFGAAGHVLLTPEMEQDAYDYRFVATKVSGGYRLEATPASGSKESFFWAWIDKDTVLTSLWEGHYDVFSRAAPTPWDDRERFGEDVARRTLPPGDYRALDGGVLFSLATDGGLQWRGEPDAGHFFPCVIFCCERSVWGSCLELNGQNTVFVRDGGATVGVELQWAEVNSCDLRMPTRRVTMTGPNGDAGAGVRIEWGGFETQDLSMCDPANPWWREYEGR